MMKIIEAFSWRSPHARRLLDGHYDIVMTTIRRDGLKKAQQRLTVIGRVGHLFDPPQPQVPGGTHVGKLRDGAG